MTLSWKQSGVVDKYVVEVNNKTVNFSIVHSDNVSVSLIVRDLLTSGAYYCISVTAVSGHLLSAGAVLCNHTGETWQRNCLCVIVIVMVRWQRLFTHSLTHALCFYM